MLGTGIVLTTVGVVTGEQVLFPGMVLLAEKAEFPEYDAGKGFGIWQPGQGDGEKSDGNQWWDWRKYWQVHVSPVEA